MQSVATLTVDLTLRERQIFELVLRGWSDKRIAEKLGLRPQTVSQCLERLSAKMGRYDNGVNRDESRRFWVSVAYRLGYVNGSKAAAKVIP